MRFKEINPKLQLSFDEYVDTWCSLSMEYHSRGLDSDITDKLLELSDEDLIRYSNDLASIILIIAIKIWDSKIQIQKDIRKKTSKAIIDKFYMNLHGDASVELRDGCIKFFNSKYYIFNKICLNIASRDPKKRQPDLIGLARYLVAQVSDRPEKENIKAIERLSLILIDTAATCFKLVQNSARDNQVLGKPRFIVQK